MNSGHRSRLAPVHAVWKGSMLLVCCVFKSVQVEVYRGELRSSLMENQLRYIEINETMKYSKAGRGGSGASAGACAD